MMAAQRQSSLLGAAMIEQAVTFTSDVDRQRAEQDRDRARLLLRVQETGLPN